MTKSMIQKLAEALEFYAFVRFCPKDRVLGEQHNDNGKVAREALEEYHAAVKSEEPCKHEARYIEASYKLPDLIVCKHCGVELVLTWTEKK